MFKTPTVKNRALILAIGMLMQLCAGILYVWSIFLTPVTEHLNWLKDSAMLTSSVMMAGFVLGIMIGGKLQDKYSPSPVAFFGSLLFGLGVFISSFVTADAPWLIYITYGAIGGFGVGCVYTTAVSVTQKWFPDKRGFATGMMVGAFGASTVIFAPVAEALLKAWGVPNTLRFFGALFCLLCAGCAVFLSNPATQQQATSNKRPVIEQKQFTTGEMLRTKTFYILAFSMFFLLPAYFILNPLLKSMGIERGLTAEMATVGVMITGIASASGRLLVSWFSDFAGRKAGIALITVVTAIAAIAMIWAEGIFFLICIAVIAFCFGGSASVYAATTADLFGTRHIGFNYGCVMAAFGSSALIFQFGTKSLSATASMILAASTCAVTLVLAMVLKIPKKRV